MPNIRTMPELITNRDTRLVDADGSYVSRSVFVDPALYQLELEKIFARAWLFLGHETQLRRPFDFFTTWMGEDAVIVTRGANGEVSAVLNSCRHRGNSVCREDSGNARAFTCAYHGWTYDPAGTLVGVPGLAQFYGHDLERDELGLVRVPQLTSYKGLLFGSFDPAAPTFEEYAGSATLWALDIIAEQLGGGAELIEGGPQKWEVDCNWKLAADNFVGDNYHGPMTHMSARTAGHGGQRGALSVASAPAQPGITFSTPRGHGFNAALRASDWQERMTKSDAYLRHVAERLPDSIARLGRFRAERVARLNGTIFPNTSISTGSSQIHVWHPKGPERTEVWLYAFVDRASPPEIKELRRHAAQEHFGPAGLFEVDDGENWQEATRACRGAVARRYPLHYGMGRRDETYVEQTPEVPRHIPSLVNEHNQRAFYRAWQEAIEGP